MAAPLVTSSDNVLAFATSLQEKEKKRQEEEQRRKEEEAAAERLRREEEARQEFAARAAQEAKAAMERRRKEAAEALGPQPDKGPQVTQVSPEAPFLSPFGRVGSIFLFFEVVH